MGASYFQIYKQDKRHPNKEKSKSRNREESRRRIMQAGLEIFSEIGYDAATTKTIAARAGLNEVLLFRYFDSKENLLSEILQFFFERGEQEDSYLSGKTVEKEIMNFFKAKLKFNIEAQNFLKVVLSRWIVDPTFNKLMAKNAKPRFVDLLTKRLIVFQEKGDIRPEVHVASIVAIIADQSFMTTFVHRVLDTKSRATCLKQFELFAQTLTEGMSLKKTL